MKHFRYIIFSIILTICFVFIFDKKSSGWTFFDFIDEPHFSLEKLSDIINIKSRGDFKDKNIFEATNDFTICKNPRVVKYLYEYLTIRRPYVDRALSQPKYNMDIIEKVFSENPDLPKGLMYLPILESGFNPRAVSRTKAKGMWQFIKKTSRIFKLKNNRWIDERYNVEKSTRAAVRHLRYLYKRFNSWELALAAYNGGAVHVSKEMKKSSTKNFWQMIYNKSFRQETREYVPRFAALLLIYKNQELFGFSASKIKRETEKNFAIDYLTLRYPVKLSSLSKISGISIKTLRTLNPELKRNITPLYCKNYKLAIPKRVKEKLAKQKKKLYKIRFSKMRKHRVKKGDCISKIAQHYRTSARKIIYFNDLKKPYIIFPGLELYIPIS